MTSAPDAPLTGVGPWQGPRPVGDQYDPVLLAEGDRRNVADRYRYWTVEAIVQDLDRQRQPLHVAIENWEHDFNIGSIVRTANAFAVAGVHIIGKRRWNRRGAMVTDRYQHVFHHPTVEDFGDWASAEHLAVIGVDNIPGSMPIEGRALPEQCVLVFGQESTGLSASMVELCELLIEITQYGSTRSINAGAAAAIAMHSWMVQHAEPRA